MKSGFVVCFYREEKKSTGKVREKYGKDTGKLTVSQEKVLDYLEENEYITNKEVQDLLGVKESRALKILRSLVEEEILAKGGKSRNSYYVLK